MKKIILGLLVSAGILLITTPAFAAEYKVVKGDTLSQIAKSNGISVEELMQTNNLSSTVLQIGQVLQVPDKKVEKKQQQKKVVSRSNDLVHERLKKVIDSLLGTPYRYGGTTPKGFDCSGFTSYVYAQLGIELPRDSRSQFTVGAKVSYSDLQFGDLVFYSAKKNGVISHVGIYVGNNRMAHAATSQKEVKINEMAWYNTNYQLVGAKRILTEEVLKEKKLITDDRVVEVEEKELPEEAEENTEDL